MYADDTHLTYAGDCVDNLQLYLNQGLENVLNWLRANKLTLNRIKTEFMLIGSRQRLSTLAVSPTITIYDNQVSQVTTAKSLGVTIDNKLDWRSHIDKLTKKVASGTGYKTNKAPCPSSDFASNISSSDSATFWLF